MKRDCVGSAGEAVVRGLPKYKPSGCERDEINKVQNVRSWRLTGATVHHNETSTTTLSSLFYTTNLLHPSCRMTTWRGSVTHLTTLTAMRHYIAKQDNSPNGKAYPTSSASLSSVGASPTSTVNPLGRHWPRPHNDPPNEVRVFSAVVICVLSLGYHLL